MMKVSDSILSSEAMIAAALRAELKVPAMADLEDIAARLGLQIVEVSSKSFEGALLRSARTLSGRILLHRDIRENGRRRFTIAHELGHFLLHSDRRIPCSPRVIEGWKEDQPKPEREADSFASELLLPTADVIERVNHRWPSIEVIVDLADHFGSSLMATARKFCDVAPQPCAVVWTSERRIRWFHGSQSFRNFIEVGEEVDPASVAHRAYVGKVLPKEMEEVPAEAWISSYWLKDGAMVSEEAVSMPFYQGCLSLIWIRRDIEDRPTAEDELLRELSPDEFTLGRKRWPR
jgi:Zn-dependent peptidase ImmA (M78 family)